MFSPDESEKSLLDFFLLASPSKITAFLLACDTFCHVNKIFIYKVNSVHIFSITSEVLIFAKWDSLILILVVV